MITLSCSTAPSDPPVRCDFIIKCGNETTITVELDDQYIHVTTQPCNFTVTVKLRNNNFTKILDQIIFTNETPLVQPTTTITTTTPTLMRPSGKHIHVCESMCLHTCVHACVCERERERKIRESLRIAITCMYCRGKYSILLLL